MGFDLGFVHLPLFLLEPGLHRLIRKTYEMLNLQTFFTAGEKEVRAWTIKKDTKAPQAANQALQGVLKILYDKTNDNIKQTLGDNL